MNSEMLLCLDCGNTRLKWGLWSRTQKAWLKQTALPLAELARLADELSQLSTGLRPAAMIGCIVAASSVRVALEDILKKSSIDVHWNESRCSQCGVSNHYEEPARLGADRWAALIGAHFLQAKTACLVVNAGTATTVDHLDAAGGFQGGLILPGIDLMRRALARETAHLPLAEGDFRALPRNTHTAIASGCLQATAGAIERMFRPLAGNPGAVCLLSGGAAGAIAPLLDIPLRHVENLVLEGLARVGESGECVSSS